MPAPDPVEERANPRLLRGLLWAGVGLAPLAALLLLLGDGTGTLRFAVLLVLVSIALIGLSLTLRRDPETSRVDLEEVLAEEMAKLRAEVRAEIAGANRAGQAGTGQRLQALSDAVEGLRAQLTAVRNERAALPQAPAPAALAQTAGTGRAAIGGAPAGTASVPVEPQTGRAAARAIVGATGTDQPAGGYGATTGYGGGAPTRVTGDYTARRQATDETDGGGYTPRRAQRGYDDQSGTAGGYGPGDYAATYGAARQDPGRQDPGRYGGGYGPDDRSGYERSGYDSGRPAQSQGRDQGRDPGRYDAGLDAGRGWEREDRGADRDEPRTRASAPAGTGRAGGRAQVGGAGQRSGALPGQLAGGIVRHTETVHVTTRSTIVDPRADDSPRYGAGEYGGDTGYREEDRDAGYRAEDRGDRYDRRDDGFDRGGYEPRRSRGADGYESTDDVAGRRAARPGQRSWAEEQQEAPPAQEVNLYARPAAQIEPSAEPSWSQMQQQAGDRWAAVRSDDRGQELRMGERRMGVRSDDTGTELRIEDRWAAVRREDRDGYDRGAANPYDRGQTPPDRGGADPRREDPQPWRTERRGGRRDEPWRVGAAEVASGSDDELRGRYDDSWRAERGADQGYPRPEQNYGRAPEPEPRRVPAQRFDSSSLYGEASQFTGEQRAISAIDWDRPGPPPGNQDGWQRRR